MKMVDEYDDIMQEISIIMYFIEDTVDCIDQYYDLYNISLNNIKFINISPSFFAQTLNSFKFKINISFSKIFDKSQSSSGIERLLNRVEQHKDYNKLCINEIKEGRIMIESNLPIFELLKPVRDKFYAHIDKKVILEQEKLQPEFTNYIKLKEMLISTWNILNKIMVKCGAIELTFPPQRKDLYRLISKNNN